MTDIEKALPQIKARFPGFKEKIVDDQIFFQSRLDIPNWNITEDKYIMLTRGREIMNVRIRGDKILEAYPSEHNFMPKGTRGDWNRAYGLCPSAVDWETMNEVDYYLTLANPHPQYTEFHKTHELVTLRFDSNTKSVNMIYGSAYGGYTNGLFGRIFKEFPKTSFCSIYYKPNDLVTPLAALVVVS
jgi:hypothetical protein